MEEWANATTIEKQLLLYAIIYNYFNAAAIQHRYTESYALPVTESFTF